MFDCIAVLHSLVCSYIQEFKKQMIFSSLDLAVIVCVFLYFFSIFFFGGGCVVCKGLDTVMGAVKRHTKETLQTVTCFNDSW